MRRDNADFTNKRVLIRCDLNVPINNNVIIDDFTARYFSGEMETKYQKKEAKKKHKGLTENRNDKCKCEYCGSEMSTIDGDITESTLGVRICLKCLENSLKQSQNIK